MPIHHGYDRNGPYYRWGYGKKYYYNPNNELSKRFAFEQAYRHTRATYSRGWRSPGYSNY